MTAGKSFLNGTRSDLEMDMRRVSPDPHLPGCLSHGLEMWWAEAMVGRWGNADKGECK